MMKSNQNVMGWPLLERFSIPVPEAGCILWTGCLNDFGYGMIRAAGKLWRAHIMAKTLEVGPIPVGLCVLHKCDTRSCINPAHLFIGTRTQNAADRDSKNRVTHGERHWAAKLSREQVIAIRSDPRKQQVIADEYGVTNSLISNIKARKVRGRD